MIAKILFINLFHFNKIYLPIQEQGVKIKNQGGAVMKKIIERVRDIVLKPKDTWPIIKGERVDLKHLFINYAVPLALIPTVCGLIGMLLIGIRTPIGVVRAPILETTLGSVIGYVLGLAGLLVGAWIIKFLAPHFNSKADLVAAAKVIIYSMTPYWVVGVLYIIPGLGIVSILAGLYGIYLMYLGLPAVLETPSDKVILFLISIIAVGFVISLVLSAIVMGAFYSPLFMTM
jgi:hypothetical protein